MNDEQFFIEVENHPGGTVTSIFEKKEGGKVGNSGGFLVLMDGQHRCPAIKVLK